MKLDRMKTCYAFDMPGNEFLPDEIEAGVKNVSLIFFPLLEIYIDFGNLLLYNVPK